MFKTSSCDRHIPSTIFFTAPFFVRNDKQEKKLDFSFTIPFDTHTHTHIYNPINII